MAVYVDQVAEHPQVSGAAARWGTSWSHMWADTPEELHTMADKLGLKRSYYQTQHRFPELHHYDVTPSKRAKAIRLGAVVVETSEYVRGVVEKHRKLTAPEPS